MCDESTNTCNLFLLFDEQTSGGDRVITDQTEGVFGCFSGCCSHFPSFFICNLLLEGGKEFFFCLIQKEMGRRTSCSSNPH